VVNKWARNGIVRFRKDGVCNSTYCKEDTGRGLLTDKWLAAVLERIKSVEFYNLEWHRFLSEIEEKYSIDQKSVVVLDPPYSQVFTTYNGGDSFNDQAH